MSARSLATDVPKQVNTATCGDNTAIDLCLMDKLTQIFFSLYLFLLSSLVLYFFLCLSSVLLCFFSRAFHSMTVSGSRARLPPQP